MTQGDRERDRTDGAIDRELVRRALREGPTRGFVPNGPPPIPAAVAVPIAFGPEPTAYAVLRAATLRDHASEVGFPGGKRDPEDVDLRATALRELEEEVALSGVEVLGELSPVPVITGRYLIHPFVVALDDARPTIASPEIAEILPIPLLPRIDGREPIHGVSGSFRGATFTTPHFELAREGPPVVLYGASAFVFYELLARIADAMGRMLSAPILVDEAPWGDRYGRPRERGRSR